MLGMIFKFTVMFAVSFIILSFRVSDRPIFNHLSDMTGPLGSDVQNSFSRSVKRSIRKSKHLFTNSDPRIIQDRINNSRSAGKIKRSKETILEDIKNDEVRRLDALINDHK